MSTNTEYVSTMQANLKKWDSDVAALAEKGKTTTGPARAAYEEGIKGLKASRDAAQRTFQQISTAAETASAQLHAGMDSAWKSMEAGLAKVSASLH